MTVLNGVSATGTPTEVFAGITDIATNSPQGIDLSDATFLSVPALFQNGAISVTFVVGVQAAGSGLFTGGNTTVASGTCQIIFNEFV